MAATLQNQNANGLLLQGRPANAIQALVDDSEQLRDIKGFQAIQVPEWLTWSLLTLAVLLLSWLIYEKLIKKKHEESLTIFQKTIKDLDDLSLDIDSKLFYLQYSEIVKLFLEERLLMPVLDKTAEEIRPLLVSEHRIQTSFAMFLSKIFSRADLAKFAKQEIDITVKSKDIEVTKQILQDIENTLLIEEERKAKAALREYSEPAETGQGSEPVKAEGGKKS